MSQRDHYNSPHGLEQSRRDFKHDHPVLYAYIAARESAKTLDTLGDHASGQPELDDPHAAANFIWAECGRQRARADAMLTGDDLTVLPGGR